MRFTLANKAYAAIPAKPGRMVGRSVAEVFPGMPKSSHAMLEKVYATGETLSLRGHQAETDLGRGPTFWDMDFIALPESASAVIRIGCSLWEPVPQLRWV